MAAHGHDPARVVAVRRELAAHDAHVDVERLGRAEPVLAPHLPHQHVARHGPPGPAHQRRQQVELAGPQVQLAVGEEHLPGRDVERERPDLHQFGGHLGPAAAERPEPGQQFPRPERFDHVVVGARVQRHDDLDLAGAGGDHEDAHLGQPGPQPPAQDDAVHVGQAEVEQDEPGAAAQHRLGRLPAVARQRRRVSLGAQNGDQIGADFRVVFDDQQVSVGHRSILRFVLIAAPPGSAQNLAVGDAEPPVVGGRPRLPAVIDAS
ncbi:hypothetical protein GCM10022254_34520 [Actinomadura meridiana]|uniref:Uncharacterized protein n=1 Tax=Actinomadura meridiana TaxID=559626 RepID=A0ABP8C3S0_9ACTN